MYGSQSIYATFERGAYCVTADCKFSNHFYKLSSEIMIMINVIIKVFDIHNVKYHNSGANNF